MRFISKEHERDLYIIHRELSYAKSIESFEKMICFLNEEELKLLLAISFKMGYKLQDREMLGDNIWDE